MGKLSIIKIMAFSFMATISSGPLHAETLALYMTEISGQTMLNDEEPGVALEIIRTASQRSKIKLKEEFVPWARAAKLATQKPNSLIVPFTRTPSRENAYTWVSTIYNLEFGFVSLNSEVNSKEAARSLPSIGVWRGSSMEEELKREGFKNLLPVSNDKTLVRMLVSGRLNAWYGSLNEAAYNFRGITEVNKKKIRYGKPVKSFPVWIAGSKNLSQETSLKLKIAIQKMHADGTINRILEKYGKKLNNERN